MLFYKPEAYMIPSQQTNFSTFSPGSPIKPDHDPVRGAAGDPYARPKRYKDILKQNPLEQTPPKFLRDGMSVDDIKGARKEIGKSY